MAGDRASMGEETGKPFRAIPEDAVRRALNHVLEGPEFRSSKRCQDFLRYAVEKTLLGHTEFLKERTIGIEVFGRTTSYDPSNDATVRVKAGEVRRRLTQHYTGDGRTDEVRIELPGGSYVPEFHWNELIEDKQGVELKTKVWWLRTPVILCVAAALVGGLFYWLPLRSPSSVVDQFWSPVLEGSSPVLLCASFVPVYGVRPEMRSDRTERLEDLVLLTDQFVGGGDLLAVSRISSMLTKMQRAYRVRIADVSFHELRAAPAILIGYSYTRWKEISKELRFFIDASRWPLGVTDNGAPTKWYLSDLPSDRRTNEDYAIVSRLFNPDTRTMLVEAAGITQYGTVAAAELLTTPELLGEALHDAPKGWQKKNLQFVLHVKVISGTPAAQKVVASYFW